MKQIILLLAIGFSLTCLGQKKVYISYFDNISTHWVTPIVKEINPPSTEYIATVIDFDSNRSFANTTPYLFPIVIRCRDTSMKVIVTASALYLYYSVEHKISYLEFENFIYDILIKQDTIELCNMPDLPYVGSSVFFRVFYDDPEFLLFRQDTGAFLEYYFKKDDYGNYTYINDAREIGAVVEQLYSWGILISDRCFGESSSQIFIDKRNYPKYNNVFSKKSWVANWMNVIGKKYYVEGDKFVKRGKEYRKKKWW